MRILLVLICLLCIPLASAFSLIHIDKEVYSLGETVAIRIDLEPDELRINGPNSSFQYLGVPRNPLVFVPQSAGEYSVFATASDESTNVSFSVVMSNNIESMHTPISVMNSQGRSTDPFVTLFDERGDVILKKRRSTLEESAAFKVLADEERRVTALIEPEDDLFEKLELYGVNPEAFSLGIDKPSGTRIGSQKGLKEKNVRILHAFAIDPTGVDFTNGSLSRVAQGTELYKCAEWVFSTQSCTGSWKKIMDLIPNRQYSVEISPADPAFAETGVATINSKLPIYEPHQIAELLAAVLDTRGILVSGAHVIMNVTSPDGIVQSFSTDNDGVVEESAGIYKMLYQTTIEGVYDISVAAQGGGVDMSMTSSFTVADEFPYNIRRESPLSIDPWLGSYRTTIIIDEHDENKNPLSIKERIPSSFIVTDSGGAIVIEENDTTLLHWPNAQLGAPLTYFAQAPLITPDLHSLGPISIDDEFYEARLWWLAIDPTQTLNPIVHINTELDSIDLSGAQVSAISTDDTSYVTFGKNSILTVEFSDTTNTTPIESVSSLSCSVTYTSESISPEATFRVDDVFGGNQLGATTLPASTGGDNTVTLSNLQNDADFGFGDLTTLNVYIRNNDGAKSDSISIDDVWCIVSYTQSDLTPPTVSLHNPDEDAFFSTSTIQFNYTPSDNRDFSGCSLYVDALLTASNSTPIVNGSINTISATIGDGVHNWSVQCIDGSSNTGVSLQTRNFTIDTAAPGVFSLTSPANNTVSTQLAPTFTWQATTEENFENYTLLLDDNSAFTSPNYVRERRNTVTNNSYTFITNLASNTLYYWRVIAQDQAGYQTLSSQTFIYIADTLIPTAFSLVSPNTGTISNDLTPLLDWSSSSDTNFANYTIQLDNNVDFLSPEFTYSVSAGGAANSSYQISSPITPNTLFYWRVIAYDLAGQSRTTSSFTYTADTLGPNITLEDPVPDHTELVTNTLDFNYTVADTLNSVYSCELVINATIEQTDISITESTTQTFSQFLDNGYYEWWVNCTDATGNENESAHRFVTVDVTVDTTPPAITLNYPGVDGHVNSSTVEFNYTPQDVTGLLNCSLYLDGSFNTTNATPITNNAPNYFSVNGFAQTEHSWHIACYDNSTNENYGISSSRNFTIDTTIPVIFSLDSPNNATVSNDPTQLLKWQATSEVNFKNYTVVIDSDAALATPDYIYYNTSINGLSITTASLLDDEYFWSVYAYDLAGNRRKAIETWSFTIHTTPPLLENMSESPASPVIYAPLRDYNFTIDVDEGELDTIYFEHDFFGSPTNVTPMQDGNTFYYFFPTLQAGSHSYRWWANDTAGNENSTPPQSYVVNKNNTAIILTLDGVSNNISINESEIVNLTASLNWPSSGSVSIRENGSLLNQSAGSVTRLKNYTAPSFYVINASYSGGANYSASSQVWYLTILDAFVPTVTLVTPANLTVDLDGLVSYGFQVQDSNTISSCTLYVDDVANGSIAGPAKGTTLFFNREYSQNTNISWDVRCTDIAGRTGMSVSHNLSVEINEFINNLVPQTCADSAACTAANMNTSNGVYEDHGTLQKSPTRNNYVYANLSSLALPLGATITNMTFHWDKYQATGSGTFYIYWLNGSNYVQVCSQAFTSSTTASPDPITCTLSSFPSATQIENGLNVRANFFYDANPSGVGFGTDYVEVNVTYQEDVTNPSVQLDEPVDGTEQGSGFVQFNITATDTHLENCTLWTNIGGSWAANGTITINDNLTSGVKSSFAPRYVDVGTYLWNAQCYDIAGNSAFAPSNLTLNVTPPELVVYSDEILFPQNVRENQIVSLSAIIHNEGFTIAQNIKVQFFLGDPDIGGVQINGNQTIASLAYGENASVNVSHTALIGNNRIFVLVDPDNDIAEANELNNEANNILAVDAYHRFYGNTSVNITLDTQNNNSFLIFAQDFSSTGNLFFARGGSSISFGDLIPIGKTTTDINTSNDFTNADELLNMTDFNDSINKQWANNTDRPILVDTFVIRGQFVGDVPIVNSDVGGNFKTGILWDSSDDAGSNLEYDATDMEDLIFLSNSAQDLLGSYGTYDYEAIVPARLREYAGGPVEVVEIYFELT